MTRTLASSAMRNETTSFKAIDYAWDRMLQGARPDPRTEGIIEEIARRGAGGSGCSEIGTRGSLSLSGVTEFGQFSPRYSIGGVHGVPSRMERDVGCQGTRAAEIQSERRGQVAIDRALLTELRDHVVGEDGSQHRIVGSLLWFVQRSAKPHTSRARSSERDRTVCPRRSVFSSRC